jgi:type IV secretory pathway VirB9-like protein
MTNPSVTSLFLILVAGTAAFAQSASAPAQPRPTASASVPSAASRTSSGMKPAAPLPSSPGATTPAPTAPTGAVRTIPYHARDLVTLRARVRFTTLIGLPDGDDIVEATCGDKEFWIVNAHGSLAYVKPAKPATSTNLNLLTTSGRVYTFLLSEISDMRGVEPDLAVYLDPDDLSPPRVMASASPKYVLAGQLDDFRAQAEIAREDLRKATEAARTELQDGLTTFRATYPLSLRFTYRVTLDRAPFFVRAMFHDDHVTYIQARAPELPALYEIKDDAANLVNFEVHDGTYVVPKVLDTGYLMLGKKSLVFTRTDMR